MCVFQVFFSMLLRFIEHPKVIFTSKCKNKDTVDKNERHQYNYLILNILKNPKAK